VGFRFIPIIDSIKYNHIKQQIIMIFRPEAKEHLNPDSEKGNFDLDDVKNLGFITSMKQVPIYNICHKNINLGSVKRSIEELRKLTNTPKDKFQQTGHFISRVIKYQVNVINKNSILTIEVAPIKIGKKITHINFIISKKGTHPIEEINQKPNSINKQLTNLGFHGDKLRSFLKIPTEVLLLSINATQKEKIKGFHTTTMRGFFFSRVERLSKNTNTKITPSEIVQSCHHESLN
jgi:plasmid replication initiation protein